VVQKVLSGIEDDSLQVAIVWSAILQNDTYQAAIRSRELVPDSRVLHYWDDSRALGTAYAPVLGTNMKMAWDVYLAFAPGVSWGSGAPPAPSDWLHQKSGEDPERYLNEEKLDKMLRSILE
jgi:hypothetical protein